MSSKCFQSHLIWYNLKFIIITSGNLNMYNSKNIKGAVTMWYFHPHSQGQSNPQITLLAVGKPSSKDSFTIPNAMSLGAMGGVHYIMVYYQKHREKEG